MLPFFVILSAAKDLVSSCLRQNDTHHAKAFPLGEGAERSEAKEGAAVSYFEKGGKNAQGQSLPLGKEGTAPSILLRAPRL